MPIVAGWPRSSTTWESPTGGATSFPRATRSLEECRARAEELGDEALRGAALRALAAVALQDGRLVVALAYAQEATLAASTAGDRRAVAAVLRQVGDEARRQGSELAER